MNFTPQFQLIDHGWKSQFEIAGKLKTDELLIVSPFIKHSVVQRLIKGKKNIRVLTRYSLADFAEGVSDLKALQHLLDTGAEVRGIKNLHAKLYVFGNKRSILTSANLTEAALTRNHELGFITDDLIAIQSCRDYFEKLWLLADKTPISLTMLMLEKWEQEIRSASVSKQRNFSEFKDYGANLGFMPDPPAATERPVVSTQAFVKFFGTGRSRFERSTPVIEHIAESDAHWSMSYPKAKRPRQVATGDIMFIGSLVASPNDILIYGRAIAYEHRPGRDDASAADIERVYWKETWSTYIRVRDPEFITGTFANGISLNQMMDELGAVSFVSTEQNQIAGEGNTNPRSALRSKAHMPLSQTAAAWLNAKFYEAMGQHGRIPISELENLYWPELPTD